MNTKANELQKLVKYLGHNSETLRNIYGDRKVNDAAITITKIPVKSRLLDCVIKILLALKININNLMYFTEQNTNNHSC